MIPGMTPADIGLPPKFSHWRDEQILGLDRGLSSQKRFIAHSMPTGCHHPEQDILMHDGTVKQAANIHVGDLLMGPDSQPREVQSLFEGSDWMYQVTPVKGHSFIVNGSHVLSLVDTESDKLKDVSVLSYLYKAKNFKNMHKLYRKGVEYTDARLPLDPYFLGVLLGDGCISGANGVAISKPDPEMLALAREQAEKFGLYVRIEDGDTYNLSVGSGKFRYNSNPITAILRELKLQGCSSGEKFIPTVYLLAGREQRLQLLAGLLDTDGHLEHGVYDYITKSPMLGKDVAALVRSLGFAAYYGSCVKGCQNGFKGIYWRLCISGDMACIPCRIPRRKAQPRLQKKSVLRTGFSIEDWGPGDYFGFEVDGDRRYLLGDFTVTHNSGKTGLGIGHALLASKRSCFLTSSKGLQEQITGDLHSIGMVDMRGRNNYPCHLDNCSSCEEGAQYHCECDSYETARDTMMSSGLVVSNYKYFMLSYLYGRGMGEFDLLIVDEAHAAPDEVCGAMAVDITFGEAQKAAVRLPNESAEIKEWWGWAKTLGQKCLTEAERLRQAAKADKADSGRVHPQTAKDQKFWESMHHKCIQILTGEGDPDWVVERTPGGYHLEPIHARLYAHKILFMDIPKVVLMSATMVQKTLDLLGVKSEESDFYEYPSSFPAKRSPVYLWGPCRVDHKILPEFIDVWLSRIDNFIRLRQDRKGIIHTVSYDRAQLITSRSEFALHMIQPGSGKDTAHAIEEFKKSSPPSILVSPAITTGYDFPFSQCEFNIICKVPFVPTTSKLMKARQAADPDYSAYLTAQTLVQAHGRSMRAADDQSETVILDQHMNWFIRKYRSLFPFWFHRLIQYPKGMPQPPAALPRTLHRLPEAAALSTTFQPVGSSKVLQFPTQRTK